MTAHFRRFAVWRGAPAVAFAHIPKTGGEAVRSALVAQRLDRRILLTGHRNNLGKHCTGAEILTVFPAVQCIFLVVRDPIDRLQSLYNHLRRWSWDPRYFGRLPNPQIAAGFASIVSFDDFCCRFISGDLAAADTLLRPESANIFLNQSNFVQGLPRDTEVVALRFSDLESDLNNFLSERFNVSQTVLQQVNESRSEGLALDGEMRRRLEEVFAEDYASFEF